MPRATRMFVNCGALLALTLVAVGCAKEEAATPTPTGPSIASTFTLGAPPDCATNKFCAPGLKATYGIEFKEVKSLDFGGPLTVAALKNGQVQVGELFSTSIYDPDFVALEDDKSLEPADNIVPVVRTAVATDDVQTLLNGVSATLTTEGILALNKKVDVDKEDPAAVAKGHLDQNGLLATKTSTGAGKTITVGVSGNFSESKIVAEMYAQVLANAGYTIKKELDLQARKASDTALFSGKIDVKPEYLGSQAAELDKDAAISGDPANNAAILTPLLAEKNVTLLNHSAAVDTNVFVVTKATATQYGLAKVSDLAKTAPASS